MTLDEANELLERYEDKIFIDQAEGKYAAYAAVVKSSNKKDQYAIEIGFYDRKPLVFLRYILGIERFDTLEKSDLDIDFIDFLKTNIQAIENIDEDNPIQSISNERYSYEYLEEIDISLSKILSKSDFIDIGFSEKIAECIENGDAYPSYSGKIELLNCGDERNPSITKQEFLEGGVSISSKRAPDNFSGTLGCIFKMKNDTEIYGLTNEHVIKHGTCFSPSNIITHPAVGDQGDEIDIGTILWKVNDQDLDAAIIKLDLDREEEEDKIKIRNSIRCSEIKFNNIKKARIDMSVNKCGRTTGLTRATIKSVNATTYHYDSGRHLFKRKQIMTSCMALPGDSGSVMFDDCGDVVGLIYARNIINTRTFANHIIKVFDKPINISSCQPKVSFDKFINNKNLKL